MQGTRPSDAQPLGQTLKSAEVDQAKKITKDIYNKAIAALVLFSITNLVLVILAYTSSIDLTSYSASAIALTVPFMAFNIFTIIQFARLGQTCNKGCGNMIYVALCLAIIITNILAISKPEIFDTTQSPLLTQMGTQGLILHGFALYQLYKWHKEVAKH